MKRLIKGLLIGCLFLILLPGCSREPFTKETIDMEQLNEMVEKQESFVLLIERDNCPFCQALNEYMDDTQEEHAGITVYVLDITDMDLKKPDEDAKTLVADTESGKQLLELVPYFYYTPTLYRFEDGKATAAGIGYNSSTYEVSLWGVDSSADLETAETRNVWDFIEQK